MRLIDADQLKADCGMADRCEECPQDARLCGNAYDYTKMDFCDWIDDAKTVDAVPVVRCKDCKRHFGSLGSLWCGTLSMAVADEFYCKCGERKE